MLNKSAIWKTLHLWRIPEQKTSISLVACLLVLIHLNLMTVFGDKFDSTGLIAAHIESGSFSTNSSWKSLTVY